MDEDVTHPSHYCDGRQYEPRLVAEDWGITEDAYLFNVLKYLSRAGRKQYDGLTLEESKVKDLKKMRTYIDFDIEYLERRNKKCPVED